MCALTAVDVLGLPGRLRQCVTCLYPCAGAAMATALAQLSAASAAAGSGRQRVRVPWPLYLIGTRDSFTTALLQQTTQVWHSMTSAEPGNIRQQLPGISSIAAG